MRALRFLVAFSVAVAGLAVPNAAEASNHELNRYAYGLADPLGMWDPTGHSAEDVGVGVDAAPQEFNRHHDEEVAKRRARGDASVASGVSTLAGPVSLITAVNSPDTSWIGTLKVVGSVVVATAATVGCTAAGAGALAGACGGAAARFFDGLVSGQGVWDLVKYTFDPKSIAIDMAVGLVSAGVARIAGSGAQLASREMTVVLASACAAVATGAVADATAVLLAGGTWSQAWAAATDWQSRLIDFGTGAVMGMREVGDRRSSQGTPATELGDGPGRTFTHFTDEGGAVGISGTKPLAVGDSVGVDQLSFAKGENPFLASEPGRVFVTDLGPGATPRQLEGIGVFGAKQQYAIEFSEADAFASGARVVGEVPSRGIYSIPGGCTINGACTVTRVR